jgi:sporulation protein YlmC with PRC-barrel domain
MGLFLALAFALALPIAATAAEAETAMASALIGKPVKSSEGEALGKLADLILDLDDGRVRYAILERLGKLHRYSLALFDPAADGGHVVLYIGMRRLEGSPGMDPQWRGFGLVRASELIGRRVEDRAGRVVGTLADIVVEWRNGTAPFAVLDLEGEGKSDRRVALDAIEVRGDLLVVPAGKP